jgi:imidazolonepropionase-like amidohydrolase
MAIVSAAKRTAVLALLVLVAPAAEAAAQTCDSSPLVVRNVRVWTPQGPLAARDVVVERGRVTSIEPAGPARPGFRVLDGSGHTLLPGLVDSHLHFSVPGGLPGPGRADTTTITARQLLYSGVTAGRLHLTSLEEAAALKRRSLDACAEIPLVQVGGPGLSGAAERDFAAFQGARSEEDAVAKVRRFAPGGVDWLALHEVDRFAPGVLRALAAAARDSGLRLMVQGSTPPEIAAALSIRPDTLDYIDRTTAPGYRAESLALIRAARDLVLVPTLGVPFRATKYRRNPAALAHPSNFRFFSLDDARFVLASARRDLDGETTTRTLGYAATLAAKLRELRTLGRPIAVGSDAGSPMHFQANAIWWEMEAWRAAGVAHREVLTAATVNGARVLRQADIGHLRPGARGDFVLYRGDVEHGPFDVERVTAVARGGVLMR